MQPSIFVDKTVSVIIILTCLHLLFPSLVKSDESPEIYLQRGHSHFIQDLHISLDGKYALSGSLDQTLRLWDLSTGKEMRSFLCQEPVYEVCISPDNRYALSGGSETLMLWDLSTGKRLRTYTAHSKGLMSLSFSPNGKYALSGDRKTNMLKHWDVSTGNVIYSFSGKMGTYSPDGKHILTEQALYDLESGKEVKKFNGSFGAFSPARVFSPDGTYIFAHNKTNFFLWDVRKGKTIQTFSRIKRKPITLAYSADGRHVMALEYTATDYLQWTVWEVFSGKKVLSHEIYCPELGGVDFSPDGKYILIARNDYDKPEFKLREVMTGIEIKKFSTHSISGSVVRFSSSGDYAMIAQPDDSLKIWSFKTCEISKTYRDNLLFAKSIEISRDGQYALSEVSGEFILWNTSTEREIKRFKGHDATISPDGEHIISLGPDKSLTLWNIRTGEESRNNLSIAEDIKFAATVMSDDGRYALSKTPNGNKQLWMVDSARIVRTYRGDRDYVLSKEGKYASSVGGEGAQLILLDISSGEEIWQRIGAVFDISPDGKFVVYENSDTDLVLWDLERGAERKTLKGHGGAINSVRFSPDGKYIAWGGIDNLVNLWNLAEGNKVKGLAGHDSVITRVLFSPKGRHLLSESQYGTLKVWDVDTGEEIISPVNSGVRFSFDDRYILTQSSKYTVILWDTEGGDKLSIGEHEQPIVYFGFSSDGKYVITSDQGRVVSWNIKKGTATYFPWSRFERNSADGGYVLLSSGFDDTTLWEIENRIKIKVFKDSEAIFSPNAQYVLTKSRENIVTLHITDNGTELWSRDNCSLNSGTLSFLPDGKRLLLATGNNDLILLDTGSGSELSILKGHADKIISVEVSTDGKYALSRAEDGITMLWDLTTGGQIREIAGSKASLSKDGKFVLLKKNIDGRLIKLWDNSSGREVLRLAAQKGAHSADISPNGNYLAVISGFLDYHDSTIEVWDLRRGEKIWTFKEPFSLLKSIVFSSTNEHVKVVKGDNSICVYNFQTGDRTHFISSLDSDEWIVTTHDGYWDSSRSGGDLVAMVRDLDVWNVDQFAARNNRPDIILERLGSRDERLMGHYYSQYRKRLRKLGIREEDLSEDFHVPSAQILQTTENGKYVELLIKLSDSRYYLKSYNIFVNDVPIFGSKGRSITGRSITKTDRVKLTSGVNKIEVACLNEKGAESYRALTHAFFDREIIGDLYFMGFGVSHYKDHSINLKYAHKDVEDLADVFQGMKGEYNKIHIRAYLNEEVTSEKIKKAKNFLVNAEEDDTFVLFIAGHGVHDTDEYTTYYYLTHNTDLNNLKDTAANFELIEGLMQGIAPRKKLFLMDTCESGEVEDEVQNNYNAMASSRGIRPRTTVELRGLKAKAATRRTYLYQKNRYIYNDLIRRSGAIVFSSSKGGEFSYEMDEIENGLFTEEIIQALSTNKADKNRDNRVSTDELRDYVSAAVAKKSGNLQHPTVDRDNIYQKFGFPVVY